MKFLILSILASSLIFIIFKLFDRFRINSFQAIVVNYFVACLTGIYNSNTPASVSQIINEKWMLGAVGLAFMFIIVFNVMALTAQRHGLSVTSVASKMSVIIPVVFGLYAYNESLGVLKTIGIILALIAVYLTSVKASSQSINLKALWLPALLFLGSGVIDTSIKYLETNYVSKDGIPIFSATIFFLAGSIGIAILLFKAINRTLILNSKSLIAGCVLGIVNYYSIYLLLKALQFENMESSTIFTINNVAIVMLSTLIGLILFKEDLSQKNWLGIFTAILSIGLVTLA